MKHLVIALAVLAALFSATLYNSYYISQKTGELTDLLEQAGGIARSGDWTGAEAATREAYKKWQSLGGYLRIVIRHDQIDDAESIFGEVLSFIQWQDAVEYSASNASLIARLRQIDEMERLSLINFLSIPCPPAACSVPS